MRRLLALAVLVAFPAFGQAYRLDQVAVRLDGQAGGAANYAAMPAPTGAVANDVAVFLGSPLRLSYLTSGTALQVLRKNAANTALEFVDPGYVYTSATKSFDVTDGRVQAANFNAIPLAAPTITPPVSPVLSKLTTITVVAGASLVDGDYFTLSDGTAKVFEFDTGDGVTAGRVPIAFTGAESATAIRDLVVIAVNGSGLLSTAVAAAADTLTVTLTTPGSAGGVNSENVANAGFLVPVWGDPTAATTYGYRVACYLADGSPTAASAEVKTTTGHATLSNANYNSITWGAVSGSSSCSLWRVTGGAAPPKLLYSGTLLNYHDVGDAGTATTPPMSDMTGNVAGFAGLRLRTVETSATRTLSTAEVSGTLLSNFTQAAENTTTLPAAAGGLNFIAVVGTAGAGAWHLKAGAGDKLYLDGTALDDGDKASLGTPAVGNTLTCIAFQTGAAAWDWLCTSGGGAVWSDGGA